MKQMKTDVVVIGSGCSGMAAALTAAVGGAKVIIFEKAFCKGGVASGGNGMFAVETTYQRDRQITFSKKDAFNFFMERAHWKTDAKLVSAYVNKSASTITWLEDIGITFADVVAYFPGAQYTWHYRDENGPFITDAIFEKAKNYGVEIYLDTPVKKILRENEIITGVIAENKDGESIQVSSKAVIIATGGFGGNAEMIKKYTGLNLGKDVFIMGGAPPSEENEGGPSPKSNDIKMPKDTKLPPMPPPPVGDGLRMAWEVGAAESEIMYDTIASMPAPYTGPGGVPFELGSFRQPNLMVNVQGERFMNEEELRNFAFWGNAVRRQKGGCAFMIFDEETNKYYDEKGWDYQLSNFMFKKSNNLAAYMQKKIDEGYKHMFLADSIEELSKKTGIDLNGLHKTLESYNKACETGRDVTFYKSIKYLRPVRKPKFYAARFYLCGYGTMGGIKINYKTEVLTKEDEVIPGLYAVGNDSNSIYGESYPFAMSGNTSGFAYNTGRIAGENAVEYIKSLK